jgi:Raf kinase inhibitor-like YbhB/YbcL family protein
LALIVDDPDAPAGDFVHWVIYNLSANSTDLSKGQPKTAILPSGAHQGINDFGHLGYDGPCPPPGPAHHYHFRLYALADSLNLPERASAENLRQAMRGKILASAEMVATFAH